MANPVILLGNGAHNNPALIARIEGMGIPVLTTWMACDLIPEDSPVFCGRPGVFGQRAANVIQQKADILICIGARLDQQQVGFDYANFAPRAVKIVYDYDPAELDKLPETWTKKHINLTTEHIEIEHQPDPHWLGWCKALYRKYRPELDGRETPKFIDPFRFMGLLHENSRNDDYFAIGSSGTAPNTFLQSYKFKRGQRFANCSTMGLMGADLPMAMGACIGNGRKRTICITGDGSILMNIQTLKTISDNHLPVKIFVFNNNGYASIRTMQDLRFEGRHVACDHGSGLKFPRIADDHTDTACVAEAFGMASRVISGVDGLKHFFRTCWWEDNAPYLVELKIDPDYQQLPKVINRIVDGRFVKTPMEDMTPAVDDLEEVMGYDG